MAMKNPEATWFGDRPVDATEKTNLVRDVFSSVAQRYDVMNDLMSLGIHRIWKQRFVSKVAPRTGEVIIDVAGGTGDIALKLAACGADVTVCDLNPDMIGVGRDRALDRGRLNIGWSVGNAQALPFPDNTFDAYTIAFGLRNVTEIDTALAEARRVLRYGGRFYCLEFSKVVVPGLSQIYDLHSRYVIPALGAAVAKDRDSYQYLVESIRRFPSQAELAQRMEEAGLMRVSVENLSGGIAAIHEGWKI
jgi:demethylmenaquinone methyltransferase/2-methoxy-6-polyprenyl-1,4-benzoquinol methylase